MKRKGSKRVHNNIGKVAIERFLHSQWHRRVKVFFFPYLDWV